MSDQGIVGQDVFLRYDGGPVQHFRAWDRVKFITSQIEQGLNAKNKKGEPEPIVVSHATEAEYRSEHRK